MLLIFFLFSVLFADDIDDNRENHFLQQTPNQLITKVDLISGALLESEIDLIVAGVEPIVIKRLYCSLAPQDDRTGNWLFNPEASLSANFEWKRQEHYASIGMFDGAIIKLGTTAPHQFMSTGCQGNYQFSGLTHPDHICLTYDKLVDSKNSDRFCFDGKIVDGSGAVRYFRSPMHEWFRKKLIKIVHKSILGAGTTSAVRYTPNKWTPFHLILSRIVLPSGNCIHYAPEDWMSSEYYPRPQLLKKITVKNSNNQEISSAHLIYERDTKFRDIIRKITIEGGDKRRAVVSLEGGGLNGPVMIRSVSRPGQPPVSYEYNGRFLIKVNKPDGRGYSVEYDDQYRVKSLRGPYGVTARYRYEKDHTIVTDAEDRQTIYLFDDEKRITAIETPDTIEKLWWSKEGDLVQRLVIGKPSRDHISSRYDYEGHNPIYEESDDRIIHRKFFENRLIEERQQNRRKTFSYEGSKLIQECLFDGERLACKTIHKYDASGCLVRTVIDDGFRKRSVETEPTANGLPETVRELDADLQQIHKTVYVYAPSGQILEERHYDAHNQHCYTLKNQYDQNERLVCSFDALGIPTVYSYDANNNLTGLKSENSTKTTKYDLEDRPIEIDLDGLITKYAYNKVGQLVSEIDPSGNTTNYIYNKAGRLTKVIYPDNSAECKEYDAFGNVVKLTDRNGYSTSTQYSERGFPIQINYPDGSVERFKYDSFDQKIEHLDRNGVTTLYAYDVFGNVIEERRGDCVTTFGYAGRYLISKTDPMGCTTYYDYDAAGRKVSESRAGRVVRYAYDALGRCTHTTTGETDHVQEFDLLNRVVAKRTLVNGHFLNEVRYRYDASGNLLSEENSKGRCTTVYNGLNQPILKTDALGNQTSYSYVNGRLVTITNPRMVTKHFEYDCCGRGVYSYTTDPSGNVIQGCHKKYDKNGNCIEERHDVYQNATFLRTITNRFTYGPCNRLETTIEAGNKRTRRSFNDRGQLLAIVYPNHQTHIYEYDHFGRVSRHSGPDFDYRYAYDRNDNLLICEDKKSQTSTKRSYNEQNELISETLANGATLFSSYNNRGQRTELILPDRTAIGFTYLGDDLQTVTRNGYTFRYIRDQDGDITSLETPLRRITYKRDGLSRPLEIRGSMTFSYSYDACGNVKSENGSAYAYDYLDQLISEDSRTYDCDSLSNRLCGDYEIDDGCRLSCFTYDDNGNVLLPGFVYDSQNRLIRTAEASYAYDAFHRRLSKVVNGRTTYFIWDGREEIGSFTTGIDELRVLGEGLGAEIGASLLLEIGGEALFPEHDVRGSIRGLSNGVKQLFNAFGEGEHVLPWTYCGKRYDSETGFIYFGRRYYMPLYGRWLTCDPAGFVDGPNVYAYVHHNPFHLDEYGLWTNPLSVAYQMGKAAVYPLFKGIELTGRHLIPLAGVRDVVEGIGRWGSGGPLFQTAWYRRNQNVIAVVPGTKVKSVERVHINGINTSFEDAYAQAKRVSEAYGGIEVVLLYNGSNGFMMDLFECCMAKLGVIAPVERMCTDYFKSRMAESPGIEFFVSAHSQGATHLANAGRRLGMEVTSHMNVHGYGGATLFRKSDFATAYNFVSSRDLIPRTNPFRYSRAQRSGAYNLIELKASSLNPLSEHSLMGQTYINHIKQQGALFEKNHLPN